MKFFKSTSFLLLAALLVTTCMAQDKILKVWRGGEAIRSENITQIDSLTFTGVQLPTASMLGWQSGEIAFSENISRIDSVSIDVTKPPVWKILWLICPETDATVNGKHYKTKMSDAQIEMVRQKAVWYEEFVEAAAEGKVDIQVTVEVMKGAVTEFDSDANWVYGGHIPLAEKFRLKTDNYDGKILTIDYTGMPVNWLGITDGSRTSWIMFCQSGCSMLYGGANPDAATKRLHTNVYVHEWCHQLESYFPKINSAYQMPILHNDQQEYNYTEKNTGLSGEVRLSKWYTDYIRGTIVHYAGATGTCDGVHPDWWQYPPTRWQVKTTPANYATGVANPPVLTVELDKPIHSTWNTGNFYIVIRDGITDVETGFYQVNQQMSSDRRKLTVDFSKPLYRMWDWKDETVKFEAGKYYRIHSYMWEYDNQNNETSGDPTFDILFQTYFNP
jgi:hypothetical protein